MKRTAAESATWAACAAELEALGMRQLEPGLLKRELAPGFTGTIGLPLIPSRTGPGTWSVEITPVIAVRHEPAARLLAIGRQDIADSALLLSPRQLSQIGDRSAALFDAMEEKDIGRAVGLAAAELIDSHG